VRRLAANGMKAWAQVIERGYEGYVAKDERSVYEGGATRRWVKVKQKDWTVEGDGWRRADRRRPQVRRPLRASGRSAAVAIGASAVAHGADPKLTVR
jgi:hypothetical protein